MLGIMLLACVWADKHLGKEWPRHVQSGFAPDRMCENLLTCVQAAVQSAEDWPPACPLVVYNTEVRRVFGYVLPTTMAEWVVRESCASAWKPFAQVFRRRQSSAWHGAFIKEEWIRHGGLSWRCAPSWRRRGRRCVAKASSYHVGARLRFWDGKRCSVPSSPREGCPGKCGPVQ